MGIQSSRTKNITKHVLLSAIYKGGSILANFLLVPLSIAFLDTENYGIWLTLSSFIAWFTFFDIGLGNGLRNKFAEARAKNDTELAKGYVSTAYYSISLICLAFLVLSLSASYFVNWTVVFNASQKLQGQLQLLMPIVFGCFSLQLMLKLITSIYIGNQDHSMQGKIGFITSMGSLLLIWVLTQTSNSSLLLFGAVFMALPVFILLILNIVAFTGKYAPFRPSLAFWKKEYFRDIFGLGLSFFVIQISIIVLFSTDNFIITQLFNPEAVVPYNLAFKYMSIASMVFTIILTPYWSSITDAYAKGELDWIKKAMKNLTKFTVGIIGFIIVLVLISPWFYPLWIKDMVEIPMLLTICMGIYFTILCAYSPFIFFMNGISKIRLQMHSFAIGALINIPLSIFLVKYTPLGVEGVIIATILCIFPNVILAPMQYSRLINKKAKGIWNK